jgi:hypothetical protein
MHHGVMKVMTLRISDNQAAQIELVARVDGEPVAKALKNAIDVYVELKKANPGFQDRLHQLLKAEQDLVQELSK